MAKRGKAINQSKFSFRFPHALISIPLLIVIIGVLFIGFSLILKIHAETRLSFTGSYTNTVTQEGKITPQKIIIPKIDLSMPVVKTAIIDGKWQVADNGASYLDVSSGINQKNSAVIYNHNTKGNFDRLKELKATDTIIIEGSDGKTYVYKVKETKIVDPTDIEILTEDKSENLIIYTCYGFADLKRFVVKAVPSN